MRGNCAFFREIRLQFTANPPVAGKRTDEKVENMSKIRIKQAIIVEGKYDKIRLSSVVNAVIVPVNGFSVFKDKETAALIRSLAVKNGVIILTDSDGAGFLIRKKIREITEGCRVINVYIPDIFGKEKRKREPSKEGLLGVEGMSADILLAAFEKAGVFAEKTEENANPVTKADLVELGLSGGDNSSQRRKELQRGLGLPEKLSANMFLEVVNSMYAKDEFFRRCAELGINI